MSDQPVQPIPSEDLVPEMKRALHHVLDAISYDPRKWELLGPGTESWSKLTNLAARIWGKTLEEIEACYQPDQRKLARFRIRAQLESEVIADMKDVIDVLEEERLSKGDQS